MTETLEEDPESSGTGSSTEYERQILEMAGVLLPAAIRAAATLKLADHVGESPLGIDTLALRSETDPNALVAIMRFLSAHGLFARHGDDHYTITNLGRVLRSDHSSRIQGILDSSSVMGRAELGMIALDATIRSRMPSHQQVFGKDFWSDVQGDPGFASSLNFVLGSTPAWDADIVLEAPQWKSTELVIDVAGGQGALTFALLERYTHLRGRILDLPNSVNLAREQIDQRGLKKRCEAFTVDMTKSIPPADGIFLLSAVLADWSDTNAVAILRNVRDALQGESTVIVSEVRLPKSSEESHDVDSAASDLYVEAAVAVPDRTDDDLVALGRSADLELIWSGPSTPFRSVLEFGPLEQKMG